MLFVPRFCRTMKSWIGSRLSSLLMQDTIASGTERSCLLHSHCSSLISPKCWEANAGFCCWKGELVEITPPLALVESLVFVQLSVFSIDGISATKSYCSFPVDVAVFNVCTGLPVLWISYTFCFPGYCPWEWSEWKGALTAIFKHLNSLPADLADLHNR